MKRFKLRNGAIVEETDGYGWYKIIDRGSSVEKGTFIGNRICLVVKDGFDIGGAHGKDFDIIEEIKTD